MQISDCEKGYKILSVSTGRRMRPADIKILYEHHFCNYRADIFLQTCENLSKTCGDRIPPVLEIRRAYQELLPQKDNENKFDTSTIARMPPEMEALLEKIKNEKTVDKAIEEDDDLPF